MEESKEESLGSDGSGEQKKTVHLAQIQSTFQDMLAEQLQRSPWLVLSAAMHGFAILILWVVVPAEVEKAASRHTEMVDTTKELVQPIEPPKPIEPVPEDKEPDPILTDTPLDPTDEPVDVLSPTTETLSAFESNNPQWNTAIGISGGAAGPYGGRPGGLPNPFVRRGAGHSPARSAHTTFDRQPAPLRPGRAAGRARPPN